MQLGTCCPTSAKGQLLRGSRPLLSNGYRSRVTVKNAEQLMTKFIGDYCTIRCVDSAEFSADSCRFSLADTEDIRSVLAKDGFKSSSSSTPMFLESDDELSDGNGPA